MAHKTIALFGGTFDPIHLGHTTVAADAAEQIRAEKIIFIPAKRSPLKGFLPRASDKDRYNMISLAVAEAENFEVSDYELNKPAPSYTLETVEKFRKDYGNNTSIHWLVGTDGIDDLAYWYKIVELIDACCLTTMYRAGCAPPNFAKFEEIWGRRRVEKLQRNVVRTPLIDISSTKIRKRIAAGQEVVNMLHKSVYDYIQNHGLYRSRVEGEDE
jgi:nicotinate-nucleotide adenylyltransferase